MRLTDAQVNLLHDYLDEIQWQLGIKIGYCSIYGAFLSDEDDFVIHEEGEVWDGGGYPEGRVDATHLVHHLDYNKEWSSFLVKADPKEFPLHDEKCAALIRHILTSMENGSLTPNPSREETVDGTTVRVEKLGNGTSYRLNFDAEEYQTGCCSSPEDLDEKITGLMASDKAKETMRKLVQELTALS